MHVLGYYTQGRIQDKFWLCDSEETPACFAFPSHSSQGLPWLWMPAARLNSHVQKQHSKRANESIPAQIGDSFKLVILNISSCGALWRVASITQYLHQTPGAAMNVRAVLSAAGPCLGLQSSAWALMPE